MAIRAAFDRGKITMREQWESMSNAGTTTATSTATSPPRVNAVKEGVNVLKEGQQAETQMDALTFVRAMRELVEGTGVDPDGSTPIHLGGPLEGIIVKAPLANGEDRCADCRRAMDYAHKAACRHMVSYILRRGFSRRSPPAR